MNCQATKNSLLDAVWGHRFVTESVIKSAIRDVRAVLHDDPKHSRYLEAVSRRGYRFIGVATGAPLPEAAAVEAITAGGFAPSAQAVLTLLCRSDAAVAGLIRAVAAALEGDCFSLKVPRGERLS